MDLQPRLINVATRQEWAMRTPLGEPRLPYFVAQLSSSRRRDVVAA